MALKRELKSILSWAESHGWVIKRSKSGHLEFKHPAGGLVFNGTTPSDPRGIKNLRAQLKRQTPRPPKEKPVPRMNPDTREAKKGLVERMLKACENMPEDLADKLIARCIGVGNASQFRRGVVPSASMNKLYIAADQVEKEALAYEEQVTRPIPPTEVPRHPHAPAMPTPPTPPMVPAPPVPPAPPKVAHITHLTFRVKFDAGQLSNQELLDVMEMCQRELALRLGQ